MRRMLSLCLIAIALVVSITAVTYAEETGYVEANGVKLYALNNTQIEGYVNIQGETAKSKIMLMVVRSNEQTWYDVKLNENKFSEQIWLNKGIGKYTVYVMVNGTDKQYTFGPKLTVNNVLEINEFLSPDKHIESADNSIIEKARELTTDLNSDADKAKAIYQWVAENVKYDYEKYNRHQNNDFDNEYGALLAMNSKKGVCYDYAALVAALGRASGLQTKVVKGTGKLNSGSGYHAWNEIYIASQNQWIKLDSTFAAMSGNNYFNSENFDESHIADGPNV